MQMVCECCKDTFEYEPRPGPRPSFCNRKCRDKVSNRKKYEYRKSLADELDLDPVPPPEVLAERRRAHARFQNIFGDPLPGRSALDRKVRQ